MLIPLWMPLMRRASMIAVELLLAVGVASAQSTPSQDQSSTTGYSSSQAGLSESGLQLAEFSLPDSAFPGTRSSAGGGSGAGQYGGEGSGGGSHGLFHNLAFEAGTGFNAPVSNDTPFITWGANFTLGGGFHFSKRVSALLEYQFMDNKLPGAFISEVGTSSGNAHFNSITGSPVIDLFPKKSNGVYLVGGFGYYHKSTNFNDYLCCDIYGYSVPLTVLSITSNQWGGNAGFGIYHRLGGMYGGSKTQLFAEARYTFINTPPITQIGGFGTTELIPVTFGVRF
jgi:hypothetical protein